jgi:hypothetical protein
MNARYSIDHVVAVGLLPATVSTRGTGRTERELAQLCIARGAAAAAAAGKESLPAPRGPPSNSGGNDDGDDHGSNSTSNSRRRNSSSRRSSDSGGTLPGYVVYVIGQAEYASPPQTALFASIDAGVTWTALSGVASATPGQASE